MINSTIVYPFKMEYVSKLNIFGLKMMVKSGLKKYFEIPPGKSVLLHRKEDLCKKMESQ